MKLHRVLRLPAFSFLVLLISLSAFSQDSISIHYSTLIDSVHTKGFLDVLASDSLEGRETGKPGQKKAAAFISEHFASLGLKPLSHGSFLQHHPLTAASNSGKNIEVNQQYFLFMKDSQYFFNRCDPSISFGKPIF